MVLKKHVIEVDSDIWAIIKAYAAIQHFKIAKALEEILLNGIKFTIKQKPNEPIAGMFKGLLKSRIQHFESKES